MYVYICMVLIIILNMGLKFTIEDFFFSIFSMLKWLACVIKKFGKQLVEEEKEEDL